MSLPTIHNVPFHGDVLATFEHEAEKWVALRPFVEALEMSWSTQHRKLVEDGGRFNCAHMSTVGSDGKVREMTSIPLRRLPGWLATINPNKIPDPVKREKVVLYQDRSYDALYDFWFKGAAIRGDMDGMVTTIAPQAMAAIGGMVKGIVGKALTETVPAMVEAEMARTRGAFVPSWTAGDVVHEVIADTKGLRGLAQMVSHRLTRLHKDRGIAMKTVTLASTRITMFDAATCLEWLRTGGRVTIERYVQMRRGQGELKLVVGKPKGDPA